jgi:phosphoribosylanthranilate isomerase
MRSVQIKICGTTNLADARYCASLGADFLGFVQHRPSPRFVEPEVAKEIIEWIEGPRCVGVFVDEPSEFVNSACHEIGFDLVQLHGDESPEYCSQIDYPVIKAFRIRPGQTEEEVIDLLDRFRPVVEHVLLDSFVVGTAGGTGTSFEWDIAARAAREYPIFLAGGLRPDNVARAIQIARPAGVDVVSGVEEHPGRKSFELLDRFFEAATPTDNPPDHAS